MGRRPGFGSIEKLASGRFRARYPGPDGRRYTAPTTFVTKTEARGWLSVKHAEVVRKAWTPPEAVPTAVVTFGDYTEGWLAQRDLKPRSREHYRKLLDQHLLPAFGPIALASITSESVRSWHAGIGTKTPTLRAHCYGLLRTILATAVSDSLLSANPCHIRGAGSTKRAISIRPVTVPELVKLTHAMPAQYQAMVRLASWCALRFGELTELRRRDVDIDIDAGRGVIHVERAVVRTAGGFMVGRPKSEAGRRDVAIPPHLLEALQEHLARHVEGDDDALLFPARHGGHLAPSTLNRHFYAARAIAGRPDLRFHDLRHTGATLAAATGASLAELMGRLGHGTPAAALRYQHVAADRDQVIAELLSKLADGG
ncbi:MAG: tyrosine recombinase XerC [Mycobacterium sp.]|uniref:site-specific integrase n=1 Tax=Mycobacterium sp. TaxID=1785 RepID=UPI003F9C6050